MNVLPIQELVLVLATTELIFFIVAHMVLCFGLVIKAVLITQGCLLLLLNSATKVKAISASHATPPKSRLRVNQELEGDTAGTADSS